MVKYLQFRYPNRRRELFVLRFFSDVIMVDGKSDLVYQHSYACRYTANNSKWSIYQVGIPEKIQKIITETFELNPEKLLEKYDPEQESSDFVYEFDSNDLVQHTAIVDIFIEGKTSIDPALETFSIKGAEKLPQSDKIDFFIHEFLLNDEALLLFSKQINSKVTKKTFFELSDDDFREIDTERIYVFSDDVTCALFKGKYYIFNVTNFHGIFKYWDRLFQIRDEVISKIEQKAIISNFKDYKDQYLKFYNLKALIKIKEYQQDMEVFIRENKDQITKICNEHRLNLEFDSAYCKFKLLEKEGVTVLNRILSNRSGFNLNDEFITFPSFKSHQRA